MIFILIQFMTNLIDFINLLVVLPYAWKNLNILENFFHKT